MTRKSCQFIRILLSLSLILVLGTVFGSNGFGQRGGDKDELRKLREGKPGQTAPAQMKPPSNMKIPSAQPSRPPSGGYSKPGMSLQQQLPKQDAAKPQMNVKPGTGYSKPFQSGRQPSSVKPEAFQSQPKTTPGAPQQSIQPGGGYSKPSVQGRQPSSKPDMSGPASSMKPGGFGSPMKGFQGQPGSGQGHRPSREQVQDFLKLPKTHADKPGIGAGKIGAAIVGGAAGAMVLDHFINRGRGAGRPGDQPEMGHHPSKRDHPGQARPYDPGHIRDSYGQRHKNMFHKDWMAGYPNLNRFYWHSHVWPYRPWNYWWAPATWIALSSWIPWNWGPPLVYDYGRNFYYDQGFVYLNGQRLCPADEYYGQAVQILSRAPEVRDDPEQWMPLGTFALTPAVGEASDMVLQLAINKEGVIQGTYYNAGSNITKPIRGVVDKDSQRAVWTFADDQNNAVIMETGIYNLTQDQTEVLVHLGKNRTEQWLLVRLNQSQD